MVRVTGGVVSYGETRKIADYENKTAKVELSFSFDDAEEAAEALLTKIQDEAKFRVQVMLGIVKPAAGSAAAKPATTTKAPEPEPEVEEPAPRRRGRPKVVKAPDPEPELPMEAETEEGPEDDVLSADAPEITDKEIVETVTAHVGKHKNPGAIKKLIGKFAPKATEIPQAMRARFLAELADTK